jgi:hypothetical protein
MIDWIKRKEELKIIILGCIEGNQNWPDDMVDAILAQEQSMIEELETDKAELVNMLKVAKDQSCGCIDYYLTDMEELIQKMEK